MSGILSSSFDGFEKGENVARSWWRLEGGWVLQMMSETNPQDIKEVQFFYSPVKMQFASNLCASVCGQ